MALCPRKRLLTICTAMAMRKNPWATELSDWDRMLIRKYPLTCVVNDYIGQFDSARSWCRTHCTEGTFTWKDARFFFKNEQDYVMFTLKYA